MILIINKDQKSQMHSIKIICIFGLILSVCTLYTAAPYAEWAHSHVVWLTRGLKHDTELYDLVKTYQSYNIPVGGVNIDSDWSECLNNFVFDKKKFPNPQNLAPYFHQQGIKIIVWATSIIDTDCPEYQEGKSKGYFLNHGKTIKWWQGTGAFVDFFNPQAKKWFQGLMDRVIDLGFDGWKCDGSDPEINFLRPLPYSAHLKRYITYRQYANEYYGTFYNYTKSKNPNTLIMARPVDSLKSKIFLAYAPKYVMFAGWVGDQHNTPEGFRAAMINIIHSASKGYLNFGFDIGGYKQRQPPTKWLFLRWAQIGALLPFMENGGNGQHEPWKYDNQTIDIYRKFVLLHYDLRQFFLSAGTEAYAKHQSVIQPLIKDTRVIQLQNPDNLGYVLWNTFLVEPIFEQSGYTEVIFPKGYKWIYYFNHKIIFNGQGQKQSIGVRLDEAALFMRSNSIIPIKKQIWLVYLQEGVHQKQVIGGNYSDDIIITILNGKMEIFVERFYKSPEIEQQNITERQIMIKMIGMGQPQTHNESFFKEDQIYQNQFTTEIKFNQSYSFTFSSNQ